MKIPPLLGIALLAMPALQAQVVETEKASFRMETLAEGLQNPWGIVRLPDGTYLVTERPGRLRVIRDGALQAAPVEGIPEVAAKGQGGLLDVELHPDYEKNGWIYLAFSKPNPDGAALTSIVRGRLKDNRFENLETVFEAPAEEYSKAGQHFGCRIRFDKAGFLYFSIGDRGTMENAQKLTNVMGKVHRIHDDGRIPADNPFVGKKDNRPTIWSYGNRNAQGLAFHPVTDELFETEHGPRGGDELNRIQKGLNYGWPVITYGINYNGKPITDKTEAPGMEQPVTHWTPSIAVAGMDFYTAPAGSGFPNWQNNLFVAALASQKLVRIELENNKVKSQEDVIKSRGRIRDVRSFGTGPLYVVFDEPGRVVRLVPEP